MGQISLRQGLQFSQWMPKYLRWVLAPSLLTYSFRSLNNSKHALLSYTRKVRYVVIVGKVGKIFFAFDWLKALVVNFWLSGRSSYVESSLPRPEDFSKALYTLDIGQNDLHGGFSSMTEKQVLALIPNIINQVAQAVEVTKIYVLFSFLTTFTFFWGRTKCKLQPGWRLLDHIDF